MYLAKNPQALLLLTNYQTQPYIFKSFQQLFRSKRLIVWAIISAHFAFQKSKMDLGIELYNVCCMVLIVLTMYYICCILGIARRYYSIVHRNTLCRQFLDSCVVRVSFLLLLEQQKMAKKVMSPFVNYTKQFWLVPQLFFERSFEFSLQ